MAERGAVLICGGLTGVMEHAARGARSAGGLTVGLLPTDDVRDANVPVNRRRQDEALVVVRVLADDVDPAGRDGNRGW